MEEKTRAAKAAKVVYRWVNQCVRQAMAAWNGYAVENARKQNLMTRIVQHLQKRCAVVALEMWQCNVAGAVQKGAEEERRKGVMQRVVKRLQHSTLASGVSRWREHVWELRRQKVILEKMASRMRSATKSCIVGCFDRWHQRLRLAGRVLKLFQLSLHRALSVSFESWWAFVNGILIMRQRVARISFRLHTTTSMRTIKVWQHKTHQHLQRGAEIQDRLSLQQSLATTNSATRILIEWRKVILYSKHEKDLSNLQHWNDLEIRAVLEGFEREREAWRDEEAGVQASLRNVVKNFQESNLETSGKLEQVTHIRTPPHPCSAYLNSNSWDQKILLFYQFKIGACNAQPACSVSVMVKILFIAHLPRHTRVLI